MSSPRCSNVADRFTSAAQGPATFVVGHRTQTVAAQAQGFQSLRPCWVSGGQSWCQGGRQTLAVDFPRPHSRPPSQYSAPSVTSAKHPWLPTTLFLGFPIAQGRSPLLKPSAAAASFCPSQPLNGTACDPKPLFSMYQAGEATVPVHSLKH